MKPKKKRSPKKREEDEDWAKEVMDKIMKDPKKHVETCSCCSGH